MKKRNVISVLFAFVFLLGCSLFVREKTINAAASADSITVNAVGKFNKIISQDQLGDGSYLISATVSNNTFFMNQSNAGKFFTHNTEDQLSKTNVLDFKADADSKYEISFIDGAVTKYLEYSGSGNEAHAVLLSSNNTKWNVTIVNSVATLTNGAVTARSLKYNSSSPRFACYTSGQVALNLYKMETGPVVETTNLIYKDGNIGTEVYTGNGYLPAVETGQLIQLPTQPVKTEHVFLGWFKEQACTTLWNFEADIATGDEITLYAGWRAFTMAEKFELNHPNVSLNLNYNSSQSEGQYTEQALSDGSRKNLSDTKNSADMLSLNLSEYHIICTGGSTKVGVYEEIRFYSGNTLVIESLNGIMNEIVINYSISGNLKVERLVDGSVEGAKEVVAETEGKYLVNSHKIFISSTASIKVNSIDITKTGLRENITINDAQLRFGSKITTDFYNGLLQENNNEALVFGTLYYLATAETKSLKELYVTSGATNLTDFVANNPTIKQIINTPVLVNANGEADEAGTHYQFATVLTGIPAASYTQKIVVSHYVIINGTVYFTSDRIESVATTAKLYLDNLPSDPAVAPHLNALKALADLL